MQDRGHQVGFKRIRLVGNLGRGICRGAPLIGFCLFHPVLEQVSKRAYFYHAVDINNVSCYDRVEVKSVIPLVDKYRPQSLDGFAGLDAPRKLLAKLAAEPYASAWLLVGPSGTGKTSMGFALAAAADAEVQHVPSRKCDLEEVERIVHRCHYAPMSGKRRWLVLVDEADQMSKPAQHAFLSILDGSTPVPDTIFIFTANATKNLEDPQTPGQGRFLSRVRIVKFQTDTEAATALLERIWKAEIAALPSELHEVYPPNFAKMLRAAGGNIRAALMTLETELFMPTSFDSSDYTDDGRLLTNEPLTLNGRVVAAAVTVSGNVARRPPAMGTDPRLPPAGTTLRREFRGRAIAVHVLAEGFEFEKRRYTSLSAIAKEVAQGNRNGFEFFGLKDKAS